MPVTSEGTALDVALTRMRSRYSQYTWSGNTANVERTDNLWIVTLTYSTGSQSSTCKVYVPKLGQPYDDFR